MSKITENIEQYIREGKIEKAFKLALSAFPALKSELGVLEADFATTNRNVGLGLTKSDDARTEYNRINLALLNLLKETSPNDDGKEDLIDKRLVEEIMKGQRNTVSLYWGFAIFSILIGLGLFGWFVIEGDINLIELASSALFTSISAFPFKEIFSRRDRITVLEVLLLRIDLASKKKNVDKTEVDDINDTFKNIMTNLF